MPPLELPAFIEIVFGQILQVPYTTGPGVAARREVIQLRSSGEMPAQTFVGLVSQALEDYGVRVAATNGAYEIIEDSELISRIPRFVRSRAWVNTPADLRPVVQFVELNAIRAADMVNILEQAFDQRSGNLQIEAEDLSNYVVLSGLTDEVNAALSIIYEMDELRYAGTQVQEYVPSYWRADELIREVDRILAAEGWQSSVSTSAPRPILLMSVSFSNKILIFTRTNEGRARVNYWLTELDQPPPASVEQQVFVYDVKNTDATLLAETANQVASGVGRSAPGATQRRAAGDAGGPATSSVAAGAFVVDPLGNRLIFRGSPAEYDQMRGLLEALDRPVPEVLIEVIVAQVDLTDSIQSGVDWALAVLESDRSQFPSSTRIGADETFFEAEFSGGTGIDVSVLGQDYGVNLNAFAQNSQVETIATPRLVARSGGSATVSVGSDVPTLSQQRTPDGGSTTNSDVVSSVVYRTTGTILNIEPIVFSNNRIDLNISQEISDVAPSASTVDSPTFTNTSVTTQLSLEDGATAVIGGLIRDGRTTSRDGVPFLKDVPVLGNAFKSAGETVTRTELVILITAYVIRDSAVKTAFAEDLRSQFRNTLAQDNLVTLNPWRGN